MRRLPLAAITALLLAFTGHPSSATDLDEVQVLRFGVVKSDHGSRYVLMTIEPPEGVADTAEIARDTCAALGDTVDKLLHGRDGPRPENIVFQVQYSSTFLLFLTTRRVSFHMADLNDDGCDPGSLRVGAPQSAAGLGSP